MPDPAALPFTPMDQAMPAGCGFIVTRCADGSFGYSVIGQDTVLLTGVIPTREQVEKLIIDAIRDNGKRPASAAERN